MTAHLALQGCSWVAPGGRAVLRDVSLSLPRGQILGIVGPNGAGKSTLLRLIYRYLRPSQGRVLLGGADIWAMEARAVARQVAAVLQEQPTDFALTVREIVGLGRAPHRRALARGGVRDGAVIAAALDRLRLADMAHRRIGTLSGGERQRVMIARALAQEPALLVLDEPTNHLDIRHQLEALALIREGVRLCRFRHRRLCPTHRRLARQHRPTWRLRSRCPRTGCPRTPPGQDHGAERGRFDRGFVLKERLAGKMLVIRISTQRATTASSDGRNACWR
jgi:iron complex transport system ATP-binding protein